MGRIHTRRRRLEDSKRSLARGAAASSRITPDHAYDLARTLAAENRELRDLLEAVAQELECMAAVGQMDTRGLLARAQRIRQRLHAL
jgi:hypothetical protein